MSQDRYEAEALDEARPWWLWRNDLAKPQHITVEPAFKSELGLVFVGIGRHSGMEHLGWSGQHNGIWLDEEHAEDLITAIRASVAWAKTHEAAEDAS